VRLHIFDISLSSGYPSLRANGPAQMAAAFVSNPTLEIKTQQGQVVPNNGVTNSDALAVTVTDAESGPGRLDIYRGDPNAGGTRVFFNDTDFDAVDHTYNVSSLGGDGQYVAKGFDRAGNASVQSFGGPLFLAIDESRAHDVRQSAAGRVDLVASKGRVVCRGLGIIGPEVWAASRLMEKKQKA